MTSTPINSQPPLYLANYPTTPTEGAPANAQYYLNIPAGMTVQPDEPSSTGAGATAVSGSGYGHTNQLYDGSVTNFGTIIGGVGAPGTGDAGGDDGGGVATGSGLTGGTGVSLAFGVGGEEITSGYNAGETTYQVVALFNEKGGAISGGAGAAGGEAAAGGQAVSVSATTDLPVAAADLFLIREPSPVAMVAPAAKVSTRKEPGEPEAQAEPVCIWRIRIGSVAIRCMG